MKRPKTFQELPYLIQEQIAGNCDLEYDTYEGSRAEAIADVLSENPTYATNVKIVENVYKNMSDYELGLMAKNQITWAENQINYLKELVD